MKHSCLWAGLAALALPCVAAPPNISPLTPTDVASRSATIHALVNPKGEPRTVLARITPLDLAREKPSWDSESVKLAADAGPTDVAIRLTGLDPGAYYSYKFVVVDENGRKTEGHQLEFGVLPETSADRLLGYWPLDGGLGEMLGAFPGVTRGRLQPEFVASPFGQGVRLNGVDQFIEIPGSRDAFPPLPPPLSYAPYGQSVSVWFRLEGKSGSLLWWDQGSWRLHYQAEQSRLTFGTGANVVSPSVLPPNDREWHHVVVASEYIVSTPAGGDGIGSRMYLDGKLIDGEFSALTRRLYDLALGGRPGKGAGLFPVSLSDFAFWGRGLTQDEVARLWNGGKGRRLAETLPDQDRDGLPDVWERKHAAGELSALGRGGDNDEDGLVNERELVLGTHPLKQDTDGDGLLDEVETGTGKWVDFSNTGTSPVWPDTDDDRIPDGKENPEEGLDPLNPDTDGDRFSDGDELQLASDARNKVKVPDLRNGLKAYWSFDENLAAEIGGYGGNLNGGPDPKLTPAKLKGNALDLNGKQSVDVVSDANEFSFPEDSFSVSVWFLQRTFGSGSWSDYGFEAIPLLANYAGRSWALPLTIDNGGPGAITFLLGGFDSARSINNRPTIARLPDARWHHALTIYHRDQFYAGATGDAVATWIDGERAPINREPGRINLQGRGTKGLRFGAFHPNQITVGSTYRFDGLIDDVALWRRALTASEVRHIYRAGDRGEPLRELISPDADGDEMSDLWEKLHGLDPSVNDAGRDAEGDGVINLAEYHFGTNPRKTDSDGDGLADGQETKTGKWISDKEPGTDPRLADSDGDSLSDGQENLDATPGDTRKKSDPNLRDTDGDGLDDGVEAEHDSDATDKARLPKLEQGVMAYWSFDQDMEDALGASTTTVKGGNIPHVPARHHNGILLDGRSQYLEVTGAANDFDYQRGDFTVSIWFRMDPNRNATKSKTSQNPDPYPGLLSKGTYLQGWRIHSQVEYSDAKAGSAGVIWATGSSNYTQRVEDAYDEKFHQLVLSVSRGADTAWLYFDGRPVVLNENLVPRPMVIQSASKMNIGYLSSAPFGHWMGVIDEVTIWKRPLVHAEVRQLHESPMPMSALLSPPAPDRKDTDHDGQPDAAELLAGTDPNNAADSLRIVQITRSGEGLSVVWRSVPNKRYQVEFASTLGGPWVLANEAAIQASELLTAYVDSVNRGNGQGYYRVRALKE